jgi:hypothetical protein
MPRYSKRNSKPKAVKHQRMSFKRTNGGLSVSKERDEVSYLKIGVSCLKIGRGAVTHTYSRVYLSKHVETKRTRNQRAQYC